MLIKRRIAVILAAFGAAVPAGAGEADPVVAEVGAVQVRASDVTRRLAAMPAYQLATLGAPADAKKSVVEGTLVRESLFFQEAERRGLRSRPDVRRRVDDALKRALIGSLRESVIRAGASAEEVRAYYDAHRADYEKPERFRLSRILVGDEALAAKVLVEARKTPGPETWNRLAREHSVDAATKMRGGNLGFVHPNGHTDVPQLEVNPALYAAAARVKDGEFVTAPVKEGERFAVVWRRGTVPKVSRSLDDERVRITDVLTRERVDAQVKALTSELEKSHLRELNPALLESLPAAVGSAPPLRPAARPPGSAPLGSADPVPRPTERGPR